MENDSQKHIEPDFFLGIPHHVVWEKDPINRFLDIKEVKGGETYGEL